MTQRTPVKQTSTLQRTPIVYPTCAKCRQKLTDREHLTCILCNTTYDLQCGNVSVALFRKVMSRESKDRWECQWCIQKRAQDRRDITNTPVGKCAWTVETEGITKKKKMEQRSLLRQLSTEDMLSISSNDENVDEIPLGNTEPSSPATGTETTCKCNKAAEVEQLKTELQELANQLITAKEEIIWLLKENGILKEGSKDALTMSHKNNKIIPKKHCAEKVNMIDSIPIAETPCLTSAEYSTPVQNEEMAERQPKIHNKNKVNTKYSLPIAEMPCHTSTECSTLVQNDEMAERHPKIHIIGDQTCKDYASLLIKLRNKYRNAKKYSVSNNCYPDATAEHIIRNTRSAQNDLHSDDWIVISIGANDINPTKLCIELSAMLKALPKTKIILMEITRNSFLSEDKLNNALKNIASNFENCEYLSIKKISELKLVKQTIVKAINNLINTKDYNACFIGKNINKVKRTVQINKTDKNNKVPILKQIKLTFGTIPYYFEKMKTNNNNKKSLEKQILDTTPKEVGTCSHESNLQIQDRAESPDLFRD